MRIQFCGADRTITGSAHLIELPGRRILLDTGLYQGPRQEAQTLNTYLPDGAARVDAVILSHGHLDHCGKLPVLRRAGYAGPIYCTAATAEVARIVLEDSAHIQEENCDYLNRRARPRQDPSLCSLYGRADIPGVLKLFKLVGYGQKTDLGGGVSFTFFDAGHILGSAYVLLRWPEGGQLRSLLFTADVGRYDAPILRDPAPIPCPVDLLITESTYGDRTHGPIADVEPQLLDAVRYCIGRRSRLLVPSFAIGRTQTVLWYIQKFVVEKKIAPLPVFVDSPMGVQASQAYSKFPDCYDDQTRAMLGTHDLFGLSRVTFASSIDQSKQINSTPGPCVIVASSPTCEFGRILHHLTMSAERPDDMIVFVGFIPANTLGRRLQDGQKRVQILDRWYDVRCQVRTIHGLSAHGDRDELLRFLKPTLTPQTTAYVVHGEADSAEAFAARLLAGGVGRVHVPARESSALVYTANVPVANTASGAEED